MWVIPSADMQHFYLPLLYGFIFFAVLIFSVIFLFKKASRHATMAIKHVSNTSASKLHFAKVAFRLNDARSMLFFLLWFITRISILLQIRPLDMTVADRWFYFPAVGLLGIAGVGLQLLQRLPRFGTPILVLITVFVISLFSIRTFMRNFDWKDNLTLYRHDVTYRPENFMLMHNLSTELDGTGETQDALKYQNMSVAVNANVQNLHRLGQLFQKHKQYDQAISAYSRLIKHYKSLPADRPVHTWIANVYFERAIEDLTFTYGITGRTHDAVTLINEEGLKAYPSSWRLYYYLALAFVDLNNYQEALNAVSKSYALSPNEENTALLTRLRNTLPTGVNIVPK